MEVVVVVPAILPPHLTEPAFASHDRPVLLIDNSPDSGYERIYGAHPRYEVLTHPENLGVARSWNTALRRGADVTVIINQSTVFQDGLQAAVDQIVAATGEWGCLTELSGHMHAWTPAAVERLGWFDENLWPAYCLVPETPILTADLRWVPIGDIEVGTRLVAAHQGGVYARPEWSYVDAEVLDVSRRRAECLLVKMEDGRSVVCTLDHRWLGKSPLPTNTPYRWIQAGALRAGCRISTPLDVWGEDRSYDAGWLAGFLDGEGCLHISPRMRGLTFSQALGPVLDRATGILDEMGVPYTSRTPSGERPAHYRSMASVEINARRHAMRVLGQVRPTRLLQDRAWNGMALRSRKYPIALEVASVEHVGMREVVTIETSTGTFIANGMVSHNCEDSDWLQRLKLADVHGGVSGTLLPKIDVPRAGTEYARTLKLMLQTDANQRWDLGIVQKYFMAKWGGVPGQDDLWESPFGTGEDWRWWPDAPSPEEQRAQHQRGVTHYEIPDLGVRERLFRY